MQEPQQISVSKLIRGTTGVYVKVRVVRKWKKEDFRKAFVGEDFSLELILVDEEGHVIQATVGKALIQSFEDKIIEGYTYKIGRFQTFQNRGYDIATAHKCRLRFGSTTTIERIQALIPKSAFKFVSFQDIIDNNLDGRMLIDVIAEVDAYDMVSNIDNLERTYLWGQITLLAMGTICRRCKKNIIQIKYKKEKPIVVLQCVLRVPHEGEIKLSTTDNASKILINPNIPQVHEFRARNANKPPRTRGIVHIKTKDILAGNIKTIDELKNIEKAGTYVIVAYITKIDKTFKWYYNGCKVCTCRAGKKADGLWYCSQEECVAYEIGNHYRLTRFQAKFYIEDAYGGKAFIKMFDKLIKMKVNKSVMQCIEKLKEAGNDHGIPAEINEFQHKEYVFKVEVDNRFNLQLNSKCYNVIDFSDNENHIKHWKSEYKKIQDITSIIDMPAISAKTTAENLTAGGGSGTVPVKKKYADINIGEETTAASNAGNKDSASKKMKSIKIEKE
ncbi:replication protein A 70 kDa DNA-binding subunit D-like [Silene latifolia]|uniref:replication protein A 70 kDa DNA-binding subunit D-like n=1 Tax=Silene latifolia TaxID=37657 RepID=UPI003D77D874